MLTWAGLLLAVLYSPIGSPDLYDDKYTLDYQGVNFGSKIENAPSIRPINRNSLSGFPVHSYQPPTNISSLNYRVNSIATPSNSSNNYNVLPSGNNSGTTSGKSGEMAAGGNAGGVFPATGNKGTNTGAFPQSPGTGTNTLLIDLTLLGSSPRFSTEYQPNSGATDPGDDEVIGDPIPVGDGWIFLLLLSLLYVLWKKLF